VYHGKWRGSDVAIKRIKKSCFTGRSSELERLVSSEPPLLHICNFRFIAIILGVMENVAIGHWMKGCSSIAA